MGRRLAWGLLLVALAAARAQMPSMPAPKSCVSSEQPPSDAEAALARDEYETALTLYREMAADVPDESRAGVIRTLIAQDKPADAEDLAQGWVKDEPQNAAAVETLGEVLYREGDFAGAYEKNQTAHALDLCNARVYLMNAALEALTANFRSARMHLDLAHRLAPQDVEIRRAWIDTLPKKQMLAEKAKLLKDESLLNVHERERLKESMAHVEDHHKDDCSLVTPVATAKLQMQPLLDGTRPTGALGLDVSFNGKRRRLELDTGASGLTLSKAAAASLGLVREQTIESTGVGDKGEVATSTAHVASVRVGSLEFRNCEVEILEQGSALDSNGLIGGNVFGKFLLTLDYPKREVRLAPLPKRPDEAQVHEVLETDAGVEEEAEPVHDRYIAPEMQDWTKVYRYGHELLLPVRIGESRAKLFLIDTGAASMLISPAAAREVTKVKNNADERIRGLSGDVDKVYQTGKFKIEFAHLYQKIDSMTSIDTTKISHNTGVEVSGFMGAPMLFLLKIQIDYRDDLVKFEYDRNQ